VLHRLQRALEWALFAFVCVSLLGASAPRTVSDIDRVRAYTRQIEFDYPSWIVEAAWIKIQQGAAGLPAGLSREASRQAVIEYLHVTDKVQRAEAALDRVYADASIRDKEAGSALIRRQLQELYARQRVLAPLAEAVLQSQVAEVLAEKSLTTLGQPIPSVLFHSSPVPSALIVSPRDHIEQIANISVLPELTIDQQAALEDRVDEDLDVSSLVVAIGGVGVYPTMITRTTDQRWLLSTIAHEWTHNYLELRPLGLLYDATSELRTMNETTADIVGGEVGARVLERFYPELLPAASAGHEPVSLTQYAFGRVLPDDPPPFDFRAEMHETRVTTDSLLAEGRIAQAEAYLEARRQLFVQNGYILRKLNQAYFAFYGAYADLPGGAAGEDPVGPAVRALRSQSGSLADFVNRIAWMTSFDQLKQAVNP
jgi:hypothetical protein